MDYHTLSCGHQTLAPTRFAIRQKVECPDCEYADISARVLKKLRKKVRGTTLTPHQDELLSKFCELSYKVHLAKSEEQAFLNDGA